NSRVLMRLGLMLDPAIYSYDLGGTPVRWFGRTNGTDNYAFRDPALRGTRLAEIVDTSQLRLWSTNGALPAAPTMRCVIDTAHGGGGTDFPYFRRPTWSPDGAVLAWEEAGGPADQVDEGI